MAFTLTLLGTDTQFTPHSVENSYDKAETLSYISTLIDGTSTGSTDDVVHLRNDKVVVIDGPTTLGPQVGDRIARGVAAVLEAISRGVTDISVIAHSRGAVEAILLAHELERIQNLLKEPNDVKPEHYNNSVCSYTKDAMNGAHKSSFEELNWGEIRKNIDKVKLSMLNIDPVPGGNYLGITRFSSLAWQDPRFYEVPKIVKEYEQFIYENERTRCFKPIVPKCVSKDTKFKLSSLPGHHGTGSGNLLDQQRGRNPTDKTTEHVQELVVIKLIDFLTRNGVLIKPRNQDVDPFVHLMADLFSEDLSIKEDQLKKIYFILFEKIMANIEAYQYYNKTAYPVLGQEQGIRKLIGPIVDQRIVHFQAHNDTFLETIVPPVPGGHFLNYDHARMHLNHELGLEDDILLSETINIAVQRLHKICEHSGKLEGLEEGDGPAEITFSAIGDPIVPTLDTEEGFALFLDGVGLLIEEVSQSYLQNKLLDSSEREAVYYAANNAFKTFKAFTEMFPDNKIALNILNTFKSNLESTLTMKHKVLKDHYLELVNRMKEKKNINDLRDKIQKIIENIKEKKSGDNLTAFVEEIELLNLQNPSTKEITKFLEAEFEKLSKLEAVDDLAKSNQALLSLLIIEALEDTQIYRIDNIIREVITSYNDLDSFRKALPDFKALDSSINYEQWETELEEYRARVVNLAAEYIAEYKIPVESIEPLFGDENQALYKQIRGLAIAFGAVNPLMLDIQNQRKLIDELASSGAKQAEVIQSLTSKKDEQAGLIELLSSKREEQAVVTQALTVETKTQASIIESLTSDHEKQAALIKDLTLEKQQLSQKNTNLAQQVTELTSQTMIIESLSSERDRQAALIQFLTNENTQQAELISGLKSSSEEQLQLTKELTASKEEQVALIEELTPAKQQLSEENTQFAKQVRELTSQLERLKLEQNAASNNAMEFKFQIIVKNKLSPMTKDYLLDLAKEVKQKIDLNLDISNSSKLAENVRAIEQWPEDKASQLLRQQFEAVSQLNDILVSKDKPSEKVQQFYQKLNESGKALSEHRDPAWKRYISNTLIVLSIIVTGIIPGLILLTGVALSGNSPQFWQSSGQTFFNRATKEIENNKPEPENDLANDKS